MKRRRSSLFIHNYLFVQLLQHSILLEDPIPTSLTTHSECGNMSSSVPVYSPKGGSEGQISRNSTTTLHLLYKGDILLGSLFPIHKQKNSKIHGDYCGDIQSEDGIQPLEAMLYTLDDINRDPHILKGVTLGSVAYDSCDDPIYASEQAVTFLEGFMTRSYNKVDQSKILSNENNASWTDLVVGMIGPQTSAVSVQLANLGRIFKVPQISYLSTSDKLCNSAEFPLFFSSSIGIMPPLFIQTQSMGRWVIRLLKNSLIPRGFASQRLLSSSTNTSLQVTINKSFGLSWTNKLSRIVIVFCDRIPAGRLLEAAQELKVFDRFLWIGSDAWASRESVVKGRENCCTWSSLQFSTSKETLSCTLECIITAVLKWRTAPKKSNLVIEEQQLYIHFVRDAVYAFAHALDNLLKDTCGISYQAICPEFWKASRTDLRTYLENVTFKDIGGNDFEFYGSHEDELSLKGSSFFFRHDGPPRYTIINFQQRGSSFDWFKIGTYIKRVTSMKYVFLHPLMGVAGHASNAVSMNSESPRISGAIASMSFASMGNHYDSYDVLHILEVLGDPCLLLFVIVAKPTNWTCGTMRFCIGFCYTICYAAVVTKTNRVSRIFRMDNANNNNNNPRWTSPLSSLCIAGALVSIEVLINTIWLIIEPPETVINVSVLEDSLLKTPPQTFVPLHSSFKICLRETGSSLEMSRSSIEAMTGNEQRHLTWSHTLSAVDENHFHHPSPGQKVRARTRSTSISRSTQTTVATSTSPFDNSRKVISFVVNTSDDEDLVYVEEDNDDFVQ
ncbi:unnamed protein product [Lepeophtheirus salmonis]|uniref:(salmon louse) hypothetical protein n=1 Tax=Lepeophtheirus salmonis TaxID=72036 RepID=A0A7R8CM01_LEPSM|nr:unnamed protein product [Lepeophtheirus salmonis]CAF2861062.1 unnamed protein product [Lepeophtheirus salmonis]